MNQKPPQESIVRLIIESPGALSTIRICAALMCLTVILWATAQHFDETELRTLGIFLVLMAGGEAVMNGIGARWLGLHNKEIDDLKAENARLIAENQRLRVKIDEYEGGTKEL